MSKKVLLIVNPKAGKLKSRRRLFSLVKQISLHADVCNMVMTRRPADATTLVEKNHSKYDIIACLGGDGTLNEVITGLMNVQSDVSLGFIPAGTTNDFARSHQMVRNIRQSAEDIMTGEVHPLDIGQFESSYFSYIASIGAFTAVSYKTPQIAKNALGYVAYLLYSLNHFTSLRKHRLTIIINGESVVEEVIFLAVTNSTSVAGMLKYPKDKVKTDDGLLELLIIRYPKSLFQWLEIVIELAKGNYQHPLIEMRSVTSLTIESSEAFNWCLDGEFGGAYKRANIQCLPKKINLILHKTSQ
jgi:YegS/Rv2252/BmrU family lipid kinase